MGFPILQGCGDYILNLIYFDGKLLMTNITYVWFWELTWKMSENIWIV